jgi:hypothetical protein
MAALGAASSAVPPSERETLRLMLLWTLHAQAAAALLSQEAGQPVGAVLRSLAIPPDLVLYDAAEESFRD